VANVYISVNVVPIKQQWWEYLAYGLRRIQISNGNSINIKLCGNLKHWIVTLSKKVEQFLFKIYLKFTYTKYV
jgi:hypothetical protein